MKIRKRIFTAMASILLLSTGCIKAKKSSTDLGKLIITYQNLLTTTSDPVTCRQFDTEFAHSIKKITITSKEELLLLAKYEKEIVKITSRLIDVRAKIKFYHANKINELCMDVTGIFYENSTGNTFTNEQLSSYVLKKCNVPDTISR